MCLFLRRIATLFASFNLKTLIWGFQQSLWSNMTPRNLFWYALSIILSIFIWTGEFILRFLLISWRFNEHLFLSNHRLNLDISVLTFIKSFSRLSSEQQLLVSPANKTNFISRKTLHRSFIYNISSLGPNTDPCGTPHDL